MHDKQIDAVTTYLCMSERAKMPDRRFILYHQNTLCRHKVLIQLNAGIRTALYYRFVTTVETQFIAMPMLAYFRIIPTAIAATNSSGSGFSVDSDASAGPGQ